MQVLTRKSAARKSAARKSAARKSAATKSAARKAVTLAGAAVAVIAFALGASGGQAQAVPSAPAGYSVQSPASSGGCFPIDYTWICLDQSGSPGSPGSGGSSKYSCTYTQASPAVLQRAGVGPPAAGYQWDIMTCPGSNGGALGGQLVQVSKKTGAPAISPVQLLQIAIGELYVPSPTADTAPPRGKDGLVGLPEWFWVPKADWNGTSVTVSAGPVWADAKAVPTELTYAPGGGNSDVSCDGPGAEYKKGGAQQSACSYTYTQPSAGQPGNAYQASLVVTWTISWTGSGGAGGTITTAYTTGTAFPVRVAQAEALVSNP
jgi:hypothetical protein